jgi:hypothetical protein
VHSLLRRSGGTRTTAYLRQSAVVLDVILSPIFFICPQNRHFGAASYKDSMLILIQSSVSLTMIILSLQIYY